MHEDLNKVLVKPKTKEIEDTNKSDEVLSKMFMKQHLKRNDSEIIKLLMG